MVAFQKIADDNPGRLGHGNRNTGAPGYKASVDYVAGLMGAAGYRVTVQSYNYTAFSLRGTPSLSVNGRSQAWEADWFVARLSGSGSVAALVQPLGAARNAALTRGKGPAAPLGDARQGCAAADFAGFVPGRLALLAKGGCEIDEKVARAQTARAAGVIVYNTPEIDGHERRKGEREPGAAFPAKLQRAAAIPVLGVVSAALGADLTAQFKAGRPAQAKLQVDAAFDPKAIDYNLIADSPYGDPNHVVVLEGHLDAIHGAGMLDNASGSATMLEVALNMAHTPTLNQLRYVWFGGEEIGLLGSAYYTKALAPEDLAKIVFAIDADVTATPNHVILVADPKRAHNAARFPPNVIPASRRGNRYFYDYFDAVGLPSAPAGFGNSGTDSNSFSLVGVPNTGILTQQNCCKSQAQVNIWGGQTGNYEGNLGTSDGGCVDRAHRWCDNLANNSPEVLEFISKAVAHVTYKLANDAALNPGLR
jgi:hypothetical protein